SSAHRFLHQRADPCLFGGGQLREREGGRPHGAFVEVRLVVEAERRVPRVELLRALEEADDLAVLGICGHPVPESRREGWRAGFDDSMEPLAHGAIRFPHLGDLREHGAFPVRLVRLQLLEARLHRASFLVRQSLLWAHRNLLILTWKSVMYLSLNLSPPRKKQMTLPSLAYAGIPYQSFGERTGALAVMIAWSRSPRARSGAGLSPIFASTALSPSALSAFSSWTRSLIAPRSSSVNPLIAFAGFFVAFLSTLSLVDMRWSPSDRIFLSCRSGEACLPPVKQTVKR